MARKPYQYVAPKPAIEPVAEPVAPPSPIITNCLRGTTLHLGDGRKLAFGESAEVGLGLAALLRERGQAE